jgi:outer membrane protein assembly factor BamB
MEKIGRMTFPNSKVGCPIIEGDLVIVRGITSNWGADGPAADRFYGFDKITGELVWSVMPGESPPKDSSFSTPVFETRGGKRVFYAGTGCGNIVCVNAYNGKALWRYKMSKGGVNSTPLIYKNMIIMTHGEENVDTSDKGRLIAIKLPEHFDKEQIQLDPELDKAAWQGAEAWRTHLRAETSSPVLDGDHIYLVDDDGKLSSTNANTGAREWEIAVAAHNIHSSPLVIDGLIYFVTEQAGITVVKPGADKAEIIQKIKLEGTGLAQPAVANGKLYVHTQAKFYAFDITNSGITADPAPVVETPKAGVAAFLQIIPAEFVVHPGETAKFKIRSVDINGFPVGEVKKASWETFIPPTAKVKAKIEDAKFNDANELVANADAKQGAGAFKATAEGGIFGTVRGRVLSKPPVAQDFEKYELTEEVAADAGGNAAYKMAYPPLAWIGARFKFQVMANRTPGNAALGSNVLGKSFDRLLFQRGTVFIGTEDMSNYTMQADVMTDGNRRVKSDVGVINQHYLIQLKGNANELEISSNFERLKRVAPFKIEPLKWYTLKTQVVVDANKINGTVFAKAWEQGQPEPAAWTLEAKVNPVHTSGSPGLFGFTPQNQKRVYLDNVKVTPNN